jgi:hypothetical protein
MHVQVLASGSTPCAFGVMRVASTAPPANDATDSNQNARMPKHLFFYARDTLSHGETVAHDRECRQRAQH